MKNNKGLVVMRATNGETTTYDPNESEFGTRKSKVTSIRVDPELYEKFKEVIEAEGKQVSTVLSEMMEKHVEKAIEKRESNRLTTERMRTIYQKNSLSGQIEFEKISRYTYAEASGTPYPDFSFANQIAQQQIATHKFDPVKTKTFIENFEDAKVTGILMIEEK